MNCIKAQSRITLFINDKLNIKELEEFTDHMETCKSCREELEVYYTLLTAMKQLDEDRNLSEDFRVELSQKLEKAKERVLHVKYTYYRKKTVLFLSMLLITIILSFRYAYKEQHENKVSNFTLRMTFRYGRDKYIDRQLEQYYLRHGLYKPETSKDASEGRKEEPQAENQEPVE